LAQKSRRGERQDENAVPLSTGECYVEFTDSTNKSLALENFDLRKTRRCSLPTEKEIRGGDWRLRAYLIEMESPFGGSSPIEIDS
jgi:hypothetical protein